METVVRTIKTTDPDETEQLAFRLAQNLRGGEVIELASDLGGGKTTFTRGLAHGLGSKDAVASPTFTISREYAGGRLHMHHFDFYRLGEAGLMADEIAEIVDEPDSVVVVEWAEAVQHVLPDERLRVSITATGDQIREFSFECPVQLKYLMEQV